MRACKSVRTFTAHTNVHTHGVEGSNADRCVCACVHVCVHVCVCVCVRVCVRVHERGTCVLANIYFLSHTNGPAETHAIRHVCMAQAIKGARPMDDVDYDAMHRALQDRHDQTIAM